MVRPGIPAGAAAAPGGPYGLRHTAGIDPSALAVAVVGVLGTLLSPVVTQRVSPRADLGVPD